MTSPLEPGYTRISFSEEDQKAREHVRRLMEQEAGLQVRVGGRQKSLPGGMDRI